MGDADNEIKAMGAIAEVMETLQDEQRGRVLRYIIERFQVADGAMNPKKVAKDSPALQGEPNEFEHFASLVDSTQPETDPMRALVAGYWLQVCKGGQSFDAQTANTELKHLGHASSNITSALGSLIGQKPALALQLRKSGNTKQARKLYKLTEAGIRKVQKMVSGAKENE